jgi:chemotaxis family two-component system response regulator Rcp1
VSEPIRILLVEDSPGDVVLTAEALREARVANELHVARDGDEALRFLRRQGEHAGAPRPDLVLLDLNLPRVHGKEVLAAMRADPELAGIPVVVLTTSARDADILDAYDLRANAYVSKPVDFTRFIDVVRTLEGFWVEVVRRDG